MARNTGPKCRQCRREGVSICGKRKCALERRDTAPGKGLRRGRGRRPSEYGNRLREKQKLKRVYGVLERQFRRIYALAKRQKGNTGENLLMLLERRLDNTVYSMGFASTRPMARQVVRHGHVTVNGRRATIPSMLVNAGDAVATEDKECSKVLLRSGLEMSRSLRQPPSWVTVNDEQLTGDVSTLPTRADVVVEINEQFVVEVCSR